MYNFRTSFSYVDHSPSPASLDVLLCFCDCDEDDGALVEYRADVVDVSIICNGDVCLLLLSGSIVD